MNELLSDNFYHIRRLAKDIEAKFSSSSVEDQRIQNEIAGMFAVTVVATYEGIVRDTLISYAARFHEKYRDHVINDFNRLNARISLSDLKRYSQNFGLDPWTGPGTKKNWTTFHQILENKKAKVESRFRTDFFKSYENLFDWRNSYAHERQSNATFRDVYESHRVAQYVIYSFVQAFEQG